MKRDNDNYFDYSDFRFMFKLYAWQFAALLRSLSEGENQIRSSIQETMEKIVWKKEAIRQMRLLMMCVANADFELGDFSELV